MIGNIEQVAKLFVTKTVYACLLAIAVGVAQRPFPFFARHLTLVSSLTIGIPAFVLALSPSERRVEPRFLTRVLGTALPAGFVAAGATFAGFEMARQEGLSLEECRTVATLVLFGVATWVLTIVARPLTRARVVLIASMIGLFLIVLSSAGLREYFSLDLPRLVVCMAVIGIIAVAGALLEIGWRVAELDLDLVALPSSDSLDSIAPALPSPRDDDAGDEDSRDQRQQHIRRLPDPRLDRFVRRAGQVADEDDSGNRDERAENVPQQELPVGHARVAGDRGHDRAQDADEAPEEDRHSASSMDVLVRPVPSGVADLAAEPRRAKSRSEVASDLVAERVAEDCADDRHDDAQRQRQLSLLARARRRSAARSRRE